MLTTSHPNDAELIGESRAGNRDAFAQIITRYQSLVCSLAYSATGSLSRSEDLAQETFVTAWQQLAELREPTKLRSWLCGIARNLIGKELRRLGREPVHAAEPIDAAAGLRAPEPSPAAQAVNREEAAILWRTLERIPETYREPLVLFYREEQSVERVAAELELSEDAVKQRLSRGRKLLAQEVAVVVEDALRRSGPGPAFTLGVLAALPVLATSAKAATLGAAAAKGSATAKAAASVGFMGAVLGPIIGLFGGVLGTMASIQNTESPRERQFMVKSARITWTLVGLFCLVVFAFFFVMDRWWKAGPVLITTAFIGLGLGYTVTLLGLILWTNRTQRRIRREEAATLPPGTVPRSKAWLFRPFEYRSRWTLFGLPVVHIRMECKPDGKTLPAKGWIAVGNIAYGALFAFGGLAIGPVSVGGFAVGLFAFGGFAVGLLSFGGFALGAWAIGGTALGYLAFGGCAMAWFAAYGGSAVAHHFAVGGVAFAQHANDEAARAFVQNHVFFAHATTLMQNATLLIWLPFLLIVWQVTRMRRATRRDN